MKGKPTTICIKCEHFISKGTADIWYFQFCGNPDVKRRKATDPVTGKVGYSERNSLGLVYTTTNPYPYARDINNGNCGHYHDK